MKITIKSLSHRSRIMSALLPLVILTSAHHVIADDKTRANNRHIPQAFSDLPLLKQNGPSQGVGVERGKWLERQRGRRAGIDTEGMDMTRKVDFSEVQEGQSGEHRVPSAGAMRGKVAFEFHEVDTDRYFTYELDRAALAKISLERSTRQQENSQRNKNASPADITREADESKSWSNAFDSRTRRAIADGYSDTHSIYQSLADYGGCSATVLSATNTRMVVTTAAHCYYLPGNNRSTSKIRPRRNGSGSSPNWGSWTVDYAGYYPQFLNNNCDDVFTTSCVQHDIVLLSASPDAGATPPDGMGWGYRDGSFLDNHTKYRRGYPGCGFIHSPNPCSTNNLYGDGSLDVGNFANLDSDGWNKRMMHSSDTNPGDSGSSLYYYRNGNPYVFGVHSASPSNCQTSCNTHLTNYARKHTPEWHDFINSFI